MRKINVTKYLSAMLLLSLIPSSFSAHAVPERPAGIPDGGCWAAPVHDVVIIRTNEQFTSNQKLASMDFKLKTENLSAWCYSESGKLAAKYIAYKPSITTPGSSTIGAYKLTEDVDYEARIYLPDSAPYAPFQDKTTPFTRGPEGNGVSLVLNAGELASNWGSNASGYIRFVLRRAAIGGAVIIPDGIELARFYRYSLLGQVPDIPIYRVVTGQVVFPMPAECSINSGQTIKVPFGSINSTKLTPSPTTSLYSQQRDLTYKCNTSITQNIKVLLSADSAGFSDAIKTSNPDIGVVMQYQNQTIKPNGSFATRIVNGLGSDRVSFTLVGSGTRPATGPFTGSATLVISTL